MPCTVVASHHPGCTSQVSFQPPCSSASVKCSAWSDRRGGSGASTGTVMGLAGGEASEACTGASLPWADCPSAPASWAVLPPLLGASAGWWVPGSLPGSLRLAWRFRYSTAAPDTKIRRAQVDSAGIQSFQAGWGRGWAPRRCRPLGGPPPCMAAGCALPAPAFREQQQVWRGTTFQVDGLAYALPSGGAAAQRRWGGAGDLQETPRHRPSVSVTTCRLLPKAEGPGARVGAGWPVQEEWQDPP